MLIRLICLAGDSLAATAGIDPVAAPPAGLLALSLGGRANQTNP